MRVIKMVTVFLGSRHGTNPRFIEATKAFAKILVQNGIAILYGGGSVGLMGVLAQEVHALGGKVIGVIPDFLEEKEKPIKYGQLIIVPTLTRRKKIFFGGSPDHGVPKPDAVITMSGAGDGTIDELAEGITLEKLLRVCEQPQILLNIDDFWQGFLMQRQRMVADGFIDPEFEKKLIVVDEVEKVLPTIQQALDNPKTNGNGKPHIVADNTVKKAAG